VRGWCEVVAAHSLVSHEYAYFLSQIREGWCEVVV
jgi:hypothetical protein